MNNDLIERVLIQLQPELAQEFGYAILEDEKKLKENEKLRELNCKLLEQKNTLREERDKYKNALEIIKNKRVDAELLMKTENAKDYNKYSKNVNQSHNLGQRQYDFLKEVLL